jgi:hypothetical protein
MHRHLPIVCALVCALPAAAAELPIRKAGLWDLKMTIEGRNTAAPAMQHCTDPSTDKLMTSNFGNLGREDCSKRDIQVAGRTITVDSICTFSGMKMTTHAVIGGDFNSAYTVKLTSTREGGPAAAGGTTTMTIEAKWLGACKADQKPGDMILPGGQKINVVDMQKLQLPAGLGGPRPGAPQPK